MWPVAVQRAGTLFGVYGGDLRSAANLSTLAAGVRAKAAAQAGPARDLVTALETRAGALGLTINATHGRLSTARDAAGLVERLARESDDVTLVDVLAEAVLPAEDAVAARSLSSAPEVTAALARTQWSVIDALATITDSRADRVQAVLDQLRTAARHDEHAQALEPVLRSTVAAAAALLAEVTTVPPPPPPPPPPPGLHGQARGDLDSVVGALRKAAREHESATIRLNWTIET